MHRTRLIAGLMLACTPLFAQEWYIEKPIRDIEFVGLETVSENELSVTIEPFIGEPFSDARFSELQRQLWALDLFESIVPNAVRPDGSEDEVIIRFEVVERPTVDRIEFEGNKSIGRNALLDVVLLKRGDMVGRGKLRVDEEAIRALYLERGYPDVAVSAQLIEDDENRVRFLITEGGQVAIERIEFIGNRFATASALQNAMELRERSFFNRRAPYQLATLEADRQRILAYYYERGFVDAEIIDIETTTRVDAEDERTFLTLRIFLEEGRQYVFGGIEFDGNSIFSDEELGELIRLQPGETLDLTLLDVDYQRVADRYYENGYIFNQITRDEIRDDAANSVRFVVNIVERNRAHIESIIIRGNEKTYDWVILREIPLEVGDVFSATSIREGLRNLANLQYFSAINPETPQGSAEGLMDLIINLEEGPTANISFGVAFGGNQEFPVSAQIQWQDQNFLGRGQTFGVQATASPINQRTDFNFVERWLFGRRWSGGLNFTLNRATLRNIPQDSAPPVYNESSTPDPYNEDVYVFSRTTVGPDGKTYRAGDVFVWGKPTADQIDRYNLVNEYRHNGGNLAAIPREYLMSYDAFTVGFGASTGYTFFTPAGALIPRTSLGTEMELITYDSQVFRPANSADRANLDKWQFQNSWSVGVALDNRDLRFNPSKGYLVDQGVAFNGGLLSGKRHYFRTDTTLEQYFTLLDVPRTGNWKWKLVLAMQSRLQIIWPNFYLSASDEAYFQATTSARLRRDGFFNARGWGFRSDGASLWNNYIELRMPLAEQVIWFDTFLEGTLFRTFEGSSTWSDRQRILDANMQDWTYTIGAGFRFVIPQFPIRLYLGKRFRFDQNGDIAWQRGNLFRGSDPSGTDGLDLIFTIGAEFF